MAACEKSRTALQKAQPDGEGFGNAMTSDEQVENEVFARTTRMEKGGKPGFWKPGG